jgi:HSP20 family molecular chaperone IbpA
LVPNVRLLSVGGEERSGAMQAAQALEEVGRLYRAITGTELPESRDPAHPIPHDREPEDYTQGRLNALFDAGCALFGYGLYGHTGHSGWMPRINAVETHDEWRLEVEVAGVPVTDLSANLCAGTLTIRGRRTHGEGGALRRSEIPNGPFTVRLRLPPGVDGNRSQARLRDGMLVVRLPKGEGYANGERTIGIDQFNK